MVDLPKASNSPTKENTKGTEVNSNRMWGLYSVERLVAAFHQVRLRSKEAANVI